MNGVATGSFPALGTTAQICVRDEAALAPALALARDELRRIDETCSRFRDDSELTLLNRSAGEPFAATPLLAHALSAALLVARRTDGAVDPTVGGTLRALGWDADFRVVVSRRRGKQHLRAVPAPGWRRVRLDHATRTVQLPPGVEIDLGATAKALAADRCAGRIERATGSAVLVNLGGDIALAGTAPADGWPVRVTDDHRDDASAPGQTVALAAGGLATSSTTVRRWALGATEVHHIVDPSAGLPARGRWRTVSVAAGSCLDANAASTAAIVRGDRGATWLRGLGLPSRLVGSGGDVVTTCGWPAEVPA